MSTFLATTNNLLRRINEVELTQTNFNTTRGIQSMAKDAVLDTIREIHQVKWKWPFNDAVEYTQLLTIGQTEYSWPTNFKSVDWNSFQLQKDESLAINSTHLRHINKDEWYSYLRDLDTDNPTQGRRIPRFVFQSHGENFGISPSPDKAYTLKYRYFKKFTLPSAYNDDINIPDEYDNVVLWGSLYHMNLFRENPEGAARAEAKFAEGIKEMFNILVGDNSENMTSSVVNFGGNPYMTNWRNYKL